MISFSGSDDTAYPLRPSEDPAAKALANGFCLLVSGFAVLPIAAFLVLAFTKKYPLDPSFTFQNVQDTLRIHGGRYLLNSLVIALLVAAFGTALAFITAYLTARMKSPLSHFLHGSAISTMAIPGIVLGLSYVLSFKGSFWYGTIWLLVMVNMVHFISSPYLMMYHALSKISSHLEGVGSVLGVSRGRIMLDVLFPSCKDTLLEMFSYFFVNCMMTISAVSFLATTANKPIALMINQFEAQMQLECAAVVSLMILLVNLLLKGMIAFLRNRNQRPIVYHKNCVKSTM